MSYQTVTIRATEEQLIDLGITEKLTGKVARVLEPDKLDKEFGNCAMVINASGEFLLPWDYLELNEANNFRPGRPKKDTIINFRVNPETKAAFQELTKERRR